MQLTKGAIGNLINRYKAVLKKCHLMNTFGSLAVAGMLVMGGAGMAVAENTPTSEVTISLGTAGGASAYNGQPTTLSDGSNSKHIFVGGTINNIKSLTPHTHFGTFTDPTSITVTGGTYKWDIYAGSLAVADGSTKGLEETSATSGSTKLVINDGTFEGAELAGGGSASTTGTGVASVTVQGDTSVTINSYTHTEGGLDYIMAGNKVLAGGGAATGKITGNTNLIIDSAGEKNVITTAVVLGGSGVRVFNGADTKASDTINGNTNVIINGDTLAGVVGGSLAEVLSGTGSATATVEGNSTVTINDGTIGQIKFGSNTASAAVAVDPSVVGGSMAYGNGAEALNKGNTLVNINGGTINDKVLGGSLAQGEGAKVTVGTEGQNNTSGIVVKNVSKVGDLVGGNMAQGGTATLYGDSYVEVEAGKVEGDVMGGSYARGAGTVTTNGNTSVVFNANNNATMPQAEYIVGGDKVLGNGTATGEIKGTSSVTVDNKASVTTGAVVGGSFSRATPSATETTATATATVANSKVTINGGTSIAGVVGGGLAENLTGVKATSNVTGTSTVYVNGGNLTNIVYTTSPSTNASSSAAVAGAGFATGNNATASVKDSVVVIDGANTAIKGNKDKDNAKVVAGGLAVNGGTVKVTNTSLTMKNGTVTGDLVGGNLLEKKGKEGSGIASTTVNVESGTVAGEIYGGSYVRNTDATSEVANTAVNISGGSIGATEPQAWAQYVVGGGKAMSNATVTASNVTKTATVNISGGDIKRGAVVGGGFARAQGTGGSATANVKGSVVNLTGGSLVGVVGGGLAENLGTETATAGVTTANLTIDGNATVNGIIYKGNDGEKTPSSAAVIGGGLAYSQNNSTAIASVETANTIINDGTINGNVFAGGMADGSKAEANVETANLTIKGGEINGSVYAGGYALDNGKANVTTANVTLTGGSINGKVTVDNATKATITLDGNGATVTKGYEGNKDSTLTFNNYNAKFDNTATGFGNLNVAEGSNVQMDNLSTGAPDTSNPNADKGFFGSNGVKVNGKGTVKAENVTATGGKTITVADGSTLDAQTLTTQDTSGSGSVKTEGLGSTLVIGNAQAALSSINDGSLSSTAGSEIQFTGLGAEVGASTILAKLDSSPTNTGIVNVGDTKVDDLRELVVNGEVRYTDWNGGTGGITNNELKKATLTGVNGDVDKTGSFGSAELAEGTDKLTVKKNLTFTGLDGSSNFVSKADNKAANATINASATLTLGDNTYAGDKGIDKIEIGNNATLNVLGQSAAAATVNSGAITPAATGTKVNAKNVTLNVAGDIGAETQAIGTITADAANIKATGDVTATTITLVKGGSVTSDKGITVNNSIENADGTLQAGGNITATDKNLTRAADGKLTVVAGDTITANNITATNVAAKKLTASGAVAVDGGTLNLTGTDVSTVDSLKLTNGTQADIKGSLTLGSGKTLTVGTGDDTAGGTTLSAQHINLNNGMLLVDPAWESPTSSNVAVENLSAGGATDVIVNGSVGVGQNSYLALGTADTGWLPGVVGNYTKGVGLSETGITAALGVFKGITIDNGKGLVVNGSLTGTAIGEPLYTTVNAAADTATFAANSLLVVNGANIYGGDKAAISFKTTGTLKVAEGAKLLVTDAVAGETYTIVDKVTTVQDGTGTPIAPSETVWKTEGLSTTTDMISLGDAKFDGTTTPGKVTTTASRNDAHTVFPNLSDGMANAVNDLYTGHAGAAGKPRWDYADVNSADMGVRFLSRATDNRFLGMDKEAAAATIESAARIAFAGAVPQMTKMASDAGTNAVVNRLGFADPADGAQAMDADGKIVDRNTTGFALWIAPLWQSQHGWGMDADSMDYGFNGNLGGVSLGADYTFENAIRAGITFNIGGGYAESSGGDLSSTDNRMNFWGLGAYAGWNYENFGVMADVSYTSTWNQLKQDVDSRMGMGDLEADVQATAISAGLRAEYLLQTSAMDIIPHIGVRYMSLNTWGYDVDTYGGTVLEGDSLHQDIWTFPIGVTFSKDFALDSGWNFKPSLDFSVIPAAGDIKAKHDVHFTGLPGTYEVETQMMDYLTWQGGVGLELANDNMSIGVNYTLQAGQHTTGHGVFGSFRYEF